MENREYYIIKIPNPRSSIKDAIDVSIGNDNTQRYKGDGSEVIIKTTPTRINKKEKEGIKFDKIFPPGLTTKVTYKEALEITRQWD